MWEKMGITLPDISSRKKMRKIISVIHQVILQLQHNAQGFWQAYRWWVVLFFVAVACDGVSTIYFMVCDATAEEMHLGVLVVSNVLGPIVGPLVGIIVKAGGGILLAIYLRSTWRLIPMLIFLVGSVMSFFAAWYNLWGYEFYSPRFLQYVWW